MRQLIEALFQKHYRDVYNYLYSLSHDASLSEDLASEVFLEVVKSVASFREESDIKTWLFSIARYKWYAYLRKNKGITVEELSEFVFAAEQGPDTQYINRVTAERICQILDAEPESTRKIVMMRLEGYSFYEIAQHIGISENSARVINFRAKNKIRKILAEEGLCDE